MPFLLLLFLTIVWLPPTWKNPLDWLESPRQSASLTGFGVLLGVGLAAFLSIRVRHLCGRGGGRELAQRPYGTGRLYPLLPLVASYGVALSVLGWGWAVQSYCNRND